MRSLRSYLTRKMLGGFIFGASATLVFGVMIWVQAVSPGAIQNPTFGPNDDDVKLLIACKVFSAQSPIDASCPAGRVMTGGGGWCTAGGVSDESPEFRPDITPGDNNVNANTFKANCSGGGNEWSFAICCKLGI